MMILLYVQFGNSFALLNSEEILIFALSEPTVFFTFPCTVDFVGLIRLGKVSERLLGRSINSISSKIDIDGDLGTRDLRTGLVKIEVGWESLFEVIAKKLHGG